MDTSPVARVLALAHLGYRTAETFAPRQVQWRRSFFIVAARLVHFLLLAQGWIRTDDDGDDDYDENKSPTVWNTEETDPVYNPPRSARPSSGPSERALVNFMDRSPQILEDLKHVNYALQGACLSRESWTFSVQDYIGSEANVDRVLRHAERSLKGWIDLFCRGSDNHLRDRIRMARDDLLVQIENLNHQHQIRDEEHRVQNRNRPGFTGYRDPAIEDTEQAWKQFMSTHDPSEGISFAEQVEKILDKCNSSRWTARGQGTEETVGSEEDDDSILEEHERINGSHLFIDPREVCRTTKRLGRGSFSVVYMGTFRERKVAIKEIDIDQEDLVMMDNAEKNRLLFKLKSETALMAKCSVHPNIIQAIGCYPMFNDGVLPFIVMERMEMTLYNALHAKTNKIGVCMRLNRCLRLMKGVASAIEFLHLQGIAHRDIKSSNILIRNWDRANPIAKISDFGSSKYKGTVATVHFATGMMSSTGRRGRFMGTPAYSAPEVLLKLVESPGRKSDIHALGVVFWECLTGRRPHEQRQATDMALWAKTCKQEKKPILHVPSVPEMDGTMYLVPWKRLQSTAKACLALQPEQRPSATCVVRMLTGKYRQKAYRDDHSVASSAVFSELMRPFETIPETIPEAISEEADDGTVASHRSIQWPRSQSAFYHNITFPKKVESVPVEWAIDLSDGLAVQSAGGILEHSTIQPGYSLTTINRNKVSGARAERALERMGTCFQNDGHMNLLFCDRRGDKTMIECTIVKPSATSTTKDCGLHVWYWGSLCIKELNPRYQAGKSFLREDDIILSINGEKLQHLKANEMVDKFDDVFASSPQVVRLGVKRTKHRWSGSLS